MPRKGTLLIATALAAVGLFAAAARAENPADNPTVVVAAGADPAFGLFDWLDHRSAYHDEFFPQPLMVDDTELEQDGEVEFSSLHTRAGGQRTDSVLVGGQKSFGLLTVELSLPYESMTDAGDQAQGVGSINLGARYPFYQFVSAGGFFDTTFGAAVEMGLPVNSAVSMNTELTPKLFNDVKLGGHFALQTVLGYSTLFGGGDNGGAQTFEYGLAFSYAVTRAQLPLPGVEQFIPLLELTGETKLNPPGGGANSLLGSLGFRLNFMRLGEVSPSLGLGYVFPLDKAARAEVRWGLVTSLTLEF